MREKYNKTIPIRVAQFIVRSSRRTLAILLTFLFFLFLFSYCTSEEPLNPGDNDTIQPPPSSIYDWSRQTIDYPVNLHDVHFIDAGIGWTVGDLEVVYSTSNGLEWSLLPVNDFRPTFRSVFFIDEMNGWMAGDLKGDSIGGQIVYSGNSGSFPIQQIVASDPLNTLFFIDSFTGWAAGDNGLILHTLNGGRIWESANIGTGENLHDIHFLDGKMGYAVSARGGIFMTEDGVNWRKEDYSTEADLYGIHMLDSAHGWICGSNNTILIKSNTDPGGWELNSVTDEFPGIVWKDIFFIDHQKGWVIGTFTRIYKTWDGGRTWKRETTGIEEGISAIHMVNDRTGWIVGESGTVLKYTPRSN